MLFGLARRLMIAVLLLLCTAGLARAHGIGTPQRINVPSGPYLVSIWTDPDPLRVDESHVVVAVMDPETRSPIVEGVTVTVIVRSQDQQPQVVTAVAQPDSGVNQLYYTAVLDDQLDAGSWEAAVQLAWSGGTGEPIDFTLEIAEARAVNWLVVGLAGAAAIVTLWLVISATVGRRARHPSNQPHPTD